MKRILFPRLRIVWVVLIIITLLPALVFSLRTRQAVRREAENVTREDLLRVVRLAADRHQRLMESTQQVLFLLARLPALRSGDLEACKSLFTDLLQQYPRYANLGIAQLNGSIAASGVPVPQPMNVEDHSWFQRLVRNPDLEPGDYCLDEISGKPAVVLSHPVLDNAGRLKFIAFAALDLGWAGQIFNEAHFPPGSVMTVSDANGRILARTLDPVKWTASPGPEANFLKSLPLEREAAAESLGVDGIRRLYAFARLYSRGNRVSAYVAAGIPTTEAYAGADRSLPSNLMVLALTAALALAAMWVTGETFVGRGLRSLGETMRRLQNGDLGARTGAKTEAAELRELSRAFDTMADSIQAAAEANRRALAAARESEARLQPALDQLRDKERQLNLALDAANQKLGEYGRSEETTREEVRHLKEALRATAQEFVQHSRNEEMLRQKERDLKQCLESSITELARLKVEREATREDLRKTRLSLESAAAEVSQRRQEAQILNQRVKLLEADLENETARNAEMSRRSLVERKRS